jgi:hypothetical protein
MPPRLPVERSTIPPASLDASWSADAKAQTTASGTPMAYQTAPVDPDLLELAPPRRRWITVVAAGAVAMGVAVIAVIATRGGGRSSSAESSEPAVHMPAAAPATDERPAVALPTVAPEQPVVTADAPAALPVPTAPVAEPKQTNPLNAPLVEAKPQPAPLPKPGPGAVQTAKPALTPGLLPPTSSPDSPLLPAPTPHPAPPTPHPAPPTPHPAPPTPSSGTLLPPK